MKTNTKPRPKPVYTHEGARTTRTSAEETLRRLTACCFLGENQFYVDGQSISKAILEATAKVSGEFARDWAIEVRSKWHMRHAPLMIICGMIRHHPEYVAKTIEGCIQRPDEMGELVNLYWQAGGNKHMLPRQMKRGLGRCFTKFDETQLSKWDSNNAQVSLRDVLFLSHAKPGKGQKALFKRIADNKLKTAPTWESELSAGKDKAKVFTKLIKDKKLGGMALIKNLRNMEQAGVDRLIIKQAINNMGVARILPFRFISAAKYGPSFEPELEEAMRRCVEDKTPLEGRTAFLVDTSGSMNRPLSEKSDLNRYEAGFGLAMVLRWACADVDIYSFGSTGELAEVPPRQGFALRDALNAVNFNGGTDINYAVTHVEAAAKYDRIIVITDEQSMSPVNSVNIKRAYMVNVASCEHGVGYKKPWQHISGFSEGVLSYIREIENLD